MAEDKGSYRLGFQLFNEIELDRYLGRTVIKSESKDHNLISKRMPFQINSNQLSEKQLLVIQDEVAEQMKSLKNQDYIITKKGNYKTIKI